MTINPQTSLQGGPHASKTVEVKLLRSVKKDIMRIVQTFVEKSEDRALLASQYIPRMLDPILGDYARNVPDARCSLRKKKLKSLEHMVHFFLVVLPVILQRP